MYPRSCTWPQVPVVALHHLVVDVLQRGVRRLAVASLNHRDEENRQRQQQQLLELVRRLHCDAGGIDRLERNRGRENNSLDARAATSTQQVLLAKLLTRGD